jgi:hypothetical protein
MPKFTEFTEFTVFTARLINNREKEDRKRFDSDKPT